MRLQPGVVDACPRLVFAAAAAGARARVDGPAMELDDLVGFEAGSTPLRASGWTGRMRVHPRQVAATLTGFRPSAEALAWARAALAAPAGGAVRVEAQMVDALVRAQARSLLDEVGP